MGISTGKMIKDVLNLWHYWCACGSTREIIEEAPFLVTRGDDAGSDPCNQNHGSDEQCCPLAIRLYSHICVRS